MEEFKLEIEKILQLHSLHTHTYNSDEAFKDIMKAVEVLLSRKTSNERKFDSDSFLEEKLKSLDIQNGFGGEFSFQLSQEYGWNQFLPIISINNLRKEAARVLFNQFDENNRLERKERFKISLLENGKNIDFNILPNAFTK